MIIKFSSRLKRMFIILNLGFLGDLSWENFCLSRTQWCERFGSVQCFMSLASFLSFFTFCLKCQHSILRSHSLQLVIFYHITLLIFLSSHSTVIFFKRVFPFTLSISPTGVQGSRPGSSVHRISQTRILEWAAISFSRGSSRPRDRTQVSSLSGRWFTACITREAQEPRMQALNLSVLLCLQLQWQCVS